MSFKRELESKPNTIYTKNRLLWIDTAKCLGIFLVVLGHQTIPEKFSAWIYSFHMPLFFFLSGYIYNSNKLSFSELLVKKSRSLLVPYLFIATVSYLFWLLIGRNYGNDATLNISVSKPLLGIFYSTGTNNWLVFNKALWFLTCLFCVELIYDRAHKKFQSTPVFIVLAFAIGFILTYYKVNNLPWGLNIAFIAIPFYGIGHLMKEYEILKKVLPKSPISLCFISLLLLGLNFLLSSYNGRVDMAEFHFNNLFVFYSSAFTGILSFVLISRILEQNNLLLFFGKKTLIILGFHGLAGTVLKAIQVFIFKIPLSILSDNLLWGILYSILIFVLLIPVFFLLEKYVPTPIGKKKSSISVNKKLS